jgi:hypothetical protein
VTGDAADVGAAFEVVQDAFNEQVGSLFVPPRWLPMPGNLRLRRARAWAGDPSSSRLGKKTPPCVASPCHR